MNVVAVNVRRVENLETPIEIGILLDDSRASLPLDLIEAHRLRTQLDRVIRQIEVDL